VKFFSSQFLHPVFSLKLLGYCTLLWFFVLPAGRAQVSPHYEQPIATPLRIVSFPDSAIHVFNEDSAVARMAFSTDTARRPGKSTTVALVASLVVPGAGQIYNGSYWKAPVIWGLGYYFISVYNQQNKLYQQYRSAYTASVDSANPAGTSTLMNDRNFYHNQRDTLPGTLLLSMSSICSMRTSMRASIILKSARISSRRPKCA
jgi:hypothetical protein